MRKNYLLLLPFLCLTIQHVKAQVDTINTHTGHLLMNKLHEGKSKYLIYRVDSASGRLKSADIWERSLQFGTKDNVPVLDFQWNWYHGDSLYRYVRAICKRSDFSPVSQYSRSGKSGIQAFDFNEHFMFRADSVAGNKADPKKRVALEPPPFNWEWDMEFFTVLPYKKIGQKFIIAFLDPSDVKSAYYTYQVIGDESLKLNEESATNCWLLKITYMPGAYGIFWVAKKTGKVLKMKELYQGTYRYKVILY